LARPDTVPVEDSEIAAIQTVVSSGFHAEPWPYLEIGQKIRIEDESLNSSLNGLKAFLSISRAAADCRVGVTSAPFCCA